MFTAAFWKGTVERCVRGFAASLIALGVADGTDVMGAGGLRDKVVTSGYAALATLLICLTAGSTGSKGDPSFTHAETTAPGAHRG